MVDFSMCKLGRNAPHPAAQSRRVMMRAVLGDDLPSPAPERDWNSGATKRPTWDNDKVGCCTACAVANAITGVAKVSYDEDLLISTPTVLDLYEQTSGPPRYNPADVQADGSNPTDDGAVFEDVISYILKNGFDRHHLMGSVGVEPTNVENIKRAIDFFGAAAIGIQLPIAWQNASAWTLDGYSDGDPNWQIGSWGGHETLAAAYNENGVWVWSWGELLYFTFDAIAKYCDEIDALVLASWIKSGKSPAGVDLNSLETYMRSLKEA